MRILKVFLDRGAKVDATDSVVAVAATVFKPLGYKRFVRPWNRFLRGWGAEAFHAADFYPGAKDFRRDSTRKQELFAKDSKVIPGLVGENVERILVVAARPEEFQREASLEWKNTFGVNIHSIGVQMCLIALEWWAEECHFNERFAYFRESGDEDDTEVASTVEKMRNGHADDTARLIRVNTFQHVEKGLERGTEASDFVAWHWNKWYMDKVRHGEADNPRKDFAALAGFAENKFKYIFLTGDSLKFFFSLKRR
jgi:hypothetical protein